MITRVWHGWTTTANAQAYEALLLGTILPGISARRIPGYRGVTVQRRTIGNEVEFVTNMTFESMDAVQLFAGPDQSASVVPAAARAVLSRYDAHSSHFEIVAALDP